MAQSYISLTPSCLYLFDEHRCYSKFSKRECKANEDARIHMNLDQPSHQHNYTEIGFKKLKAPKAAWEPLLKFYGEYLIGRPTFSPSFALHIFLVSFIFHVSDIDCPYNDLNFVLQRGEQR